MKIVVISRELPNMLKIITFGYYFALKRSLSKSIMKIETTSMSVKLTKSPAEQQSHNHGIQLNANKPLKHNCRVKDRETLGHYKVVNIKVLMLHVTSFQFWQIFQFSRKKN